MKNNKVKSTNNTLNDVSIDPKLWDRLIWQEALNKAIKQNQKKNLKSKNHHRLN